ncbi:MAG: peptide-methionine (R)-S-oxide reductase MsrB [Proteobacteria bacterium]|nr:peptide-methionine (R)-S-oxide reductase MsrB [Pseudomonadota bacterium]
MTRRSILKLGVGSLATLCLGIRRAKAETPADAAALAALRRAWPKLRAAGIAVVEPTPALQRSHEQWRALLPADAYAVLFEEDTERPFSSPLNDEKRDGLYVCRACDLPLFSSAMKFDSGTGWPSFFTAIETHLATQRDFKLIWPRTEYHCAKCGGHQGHVFDDGPAPTGQRWCNNGVALRFVALAS